MALEIDYFEYANDTDARLAYVTDATAINVALSQTVTSGDTAPENPEYLVDGLLDNRAYIGATTGWFKIQLGVTANIVTYKMYPQAGNLTRAPRDWTLKASNTGAFAGEETTLDTQTDQDFSDGQPKTYNITNTAFFTYYKLIWTDNNGNAGSSLAELELYAKPLQSYSEATIKTQGSYALKAVAAITDSLNKTLTHTFDPPLDLSGKNSFSLDMRATRTGANVKVGLRNHNIDVVDQQQTTGIGGGALGDIGGTEYRRAQSFQLSGAKTITAVELSAVVEAGTPSGNWTLRIETNNAGVPSGTLADANASIVVSPGAPAKGTFATPFTLSASTTYWLVWQCDNQSNDTYWLIKAIEPSAYASGNAAYSANGSWTAQSTVDLYFKVYVQDYTTTELTPTINSADTYQTVSWDLSGVSDANKNAIDTFIITPVNADAVNTVYFDNFIALIAYSSIGDLSINLTPASIINKIISILGNLSIVLTPNSLYELINQVFEIIGNLNINLIPNSLVSGNYLRTGNLNINLLPTSIINKSLTIPSNLLVEFIVHSIINKSVIKTSNLQINIVPNASYIRNYDRNGNLIIELIPNATGNISYGRLGDLLINLSPEAIVKFKHTTLRNNDFFLFFS
jgi:hypothetical protein